MVTPLQNLNQELKDFIRFKFSLNGKQTKEIQVWDLAKLFDFLIDHNYEVNIAITDLNAYNDQDDKSLTKTKGKLTFINNGSKI